MLALMWRSIPVWDKLLAAAALLMVPVAGDFMVRYGVLPEYLAYVGIHVGLVVTMLLRTRFVVPSFVGTYALMGGLAFLYGVSRVNLGVTPMLIAAPAALWAVTRWAASQWWGIVGLMLGIAGSFVSPIRTPVPMLGIAAHVVALIGCYVWASLLRNRQARHEAEAEARERVWRAHAETVVKSERNEIAREVHDLVAHSLAVVKVQAATALSLGSDTQARTALQSIHDSSDAALAEVRRLVAAMRDDGRTWPDNDLLKVGELVENARAAGVRLCVDVPPVDVLREWQSAWDAQTRLTVVRTVQEGLTNVIKHGGSRPSATLDLRVEERCCRIRITNSVPAQEPGERGFGLVGLAERIALAGGTLRTRHQPTDPADDRTAGVFVVEAAIPVRP